MLTVIQLSDTHFSTPGNRSHGGFGYDTDAAFDAVLTDAFDDNTPDLVVVTGDIADHGRPDEYEVATGHLSRIPAPVNIVPGNHDFDLPLTASVPRPGLSMDRVQRFGPWLFIYADSNFDGRTVAEDGRLIDLDRRIEATGQLGPREVAWIDGVIEAAEAEHVFVWMHHPPGMPGTFGSSALDDEVVGLVDRNPNIAGFAAGHIHADPVLEIGGRPVFVSCALTISFDFDHWTTLPPGYRSFRFHDDGTVTSDSHLIDDPRWPRVDLPDAVVRHFKGELSWDEMLAEITVTR